jgi:hypothetical protein
LLLMAALCFWSPLPVAAAPTTGPALAPAAPEAGEASSPQPGDTAAAPLSPVDEQAAALAQALRQEVPKAIVDTPQSAQSWIERAQAVIAAGGYKIERPQLLVVVDRNPRVQQMRIVLARPDGPWQSLGGTKVSTGRPRGFEHFLTPTGVFPHTSRILDWRAEGTFNENHVRGLGVEGMRVWDFGWQPALKGWGPPGGVGKMRLLVHATDPATLERQVGRPASDGCVRIPTAMNRFLDLHGVLDSDYEQAARRNARFAKVLLSDRAPTPLAGDALVIIDSSENPGMQGSTNAAQATTNQVSAPAQASRPAAAANTKGRIERHGASHHSRRAAVHKHHRRA